uniref:Uncharacterized protein n=1 Tax=Ascaris lumbricoides TaxID=6252 RepID=A0A0M3ITP2_ASCLU
MLYRFLQGQNTRKASNVLFTIRSYLNFEMFDRSHKYSKKIFFCSSNLVLLINVQFKK